MFFFVFCFFICACLAFPGVAKRAFVERRFVEHQTPQASEPVYLTFALKQRNLQQLESYVDKVSDPFNALYGKYMSVDELRELVGASSESMSAVRAWIDSRLQAQDVVVARTGDFVSVTTNVGAVEAAFNVQMTWFAHKHSKRQILRTLDQPQFALAEHVDLITGLTDFFDFPHERRMSVQADAEQNKAALAVNNAPDILPIRGSQQRLEVQMMMYDASGNKLMHLSGDTVTVSVNTTLGESKSANFMVDAQHCEILGGGRAGAGVACRVQFTMGLPYPRVRISAQTFFRNGGSSNVGKYMVEGTMAAWVDPHVIYDLYGIPHNYVASSGKSTAAVTAFEKQWISLDDLKQFYHLNGLNYDSNLIEIVGPNNSTKPGGESTLDITYISSVARNVHSSFLSFCNGHGPAKGSCGSYILQWAEYVSNLTNPPLVTSISYGDTEQGYFAKFGSYSYIHRMEAELMKMAARGLTVVAGSGDAGSSNVGEAGNDISPTDPTCSPVRPFYPSNSKYVVSLSATLLTTQTTPLCANHTGTNPTGMQCHRLGESIVSMATSGTYWTTGGGFSGLFSAPAWQKQAIASYMSHNPKLPTAGTWNPKGRAYADLSALGFNLNMVLGGHVTPVGGTSASGPVLAGILALLNDVQLSRGRPPLGAPHQWLYGVLAKTPGAFNDMAFGDNGSGDWQARGSPYPSFCPKGGFEATPGYDPVSGLGSPRWKVWKANLP